MRRACSTPSIPIAILFALPRRGFFCADARAPTSSASRTCDMLTRTRDRTWTFGKPFTLKGVDHPIPAGSYRVATDEELIEGLSFPVYRRVATMIFVPGRNSAALEMVNIDPADLQAAKERDVADPAR